MNDDYVKRSDVHKVFQLKYAPAINKTFAAMIDSVPAADVVERPRWIPVTERLPSPMRAVLVYAPYKHNIFMAYLQGEKWYVWGPDEYCCHNWPEYHAITHWMNLPQEPEPPKEEDNG